MKRPRPPNSLTPAVCSTTQTDGRAHPREGGRVAIIVIHEAPSTFPSARDNSSSNEALTPWAGPQSVAYHRHLPTLNAEPEQRTTGRHPDVITRGATSASSSKTPRSTAVASRCGLRFGPTFLMSLTIPWDRVTTLSRWRHGSNPVGAATPAHRVGRLRRHRPRQRWTGKRSSTTRFLDIHTDVGAKAAVERDAVITAPDARVRTLVVTFRDDLRSPASPAPP